MKVTNYGAKKNETSLKTAPLEFVLLMEMVPPERRISLAADINKWMRKIR